MENRKKKTMATANYLHSVTQNYKDNMVDCFLFFTDEMIYRVSQKFVPLLYKSVMQYHKIILS